MAHPVTHFEVNARDAKAARKFYGELFGWKIDLDEPSGYGMANAKGTTNSGINGGIAPSRSGEGYVTFYVETSDLAKTLAKAEQLGGRTVMPPMEMGGVSFALFADPEGLVIGLAQTAAPAPRKRTVRKAVKKTAKHATARKKTTRTRRRR